jgi:acyl-CoA oxidase
MTEKKISSFDPFFKELSQKQRVNSNYTVTSNGLRHLIKSNYLKYSDIVDWPEKFLEAHKNISRFDGLEGFSIKFTVQFNLFAGSIMNMGNENHKKLLFESQQKGELGCFMLTEYSAGVTSGMIVNTRADIVNNTIVINTPDIVYNDDDKDINFEKTVHRKNWISQGMTATLGVVIAQLYSENNQYLGIYPFLIDMTDENIHKKDNGKKTGLNSLDNAQIIFKGLVIQKDQLMGDSINEIMYYSDKQILNGFTRIATRLNSGRLCIAYSLLSYVTRLVEQTKSGPLNKLIYLDKDIQIKLKDMPEIRDMINDAEYNLNIMHHFINIVKKEYCECVRNKIIDLPPDLIEKIIVTKIISINYGIKILNSIRTKIGSSSLFAQNNLGSNLDIMLCGRFAEGDNDILGRKLVMDRIKKFKNISHKEKILRVYIKPITDSESKENYKIARLAFMIQQSATKNDAVYEFNRNYVFINSCVEIICFNIIKNTMPNYKKKLFISHIKSML